MRAVRIFRNLRVFVGIVLGTFIALPAQAGPIDAAAAWLLAQQTASGGFPWTSGGSIKDNTQGATALGLIGAYYETGNASYLAAAKKTGDYILSPSFRHYSDGDPKFSSHDPLFLEILSAVTGDPSYANFAQTNFWDKLSAGTYGEGNNADAAGFANLVITGRTGQGKVELSPWDLSKTAIGAHIAGETAARDAFMNGILTGLESTTTADNDHDLLALAGAIWASAVTGIDLDPTAGRWAAANSTADLAAELVHYINANGGWVWSTGANINDLINGDLQTTAFSILGLEAFDPTTYAAQISGGRAYILSLQQSSGLLLPYPTATSTTPGSVEVHGEALHALTSAKFPLLVQVPEPGSLTLLGFGIAAFGLMKRRRREARI